MENQDFPHNHFPRDKPVFQKERGESFQFVHTGEREGPPRTPGPWEVCEVSAQQGSLGDIKG